MHEHVNNKMVKLITLANSTTRGDTPRTWGHAGEDSYINEEFIQPRKFTRGGGGIHNVWDNFIRWG